jgi:hypothetical protein
MVLVAGPRVQAVFPKTFIFWVIYIFLGFRPWTIGPGRTFDVSGFISLFYDDFGIFCGPRSGPRLVQGEGYGLWTGFL